MQQELETNHTMIKVDGGNPLFATRRVAPDFKSPPVVVVGLPRSGTSFLSHVLTAIENWYVFDDFYFRRKAIGFGVNGSITPEQLKKLAHWLTWQVRARIKWENDFSKPLCTLEDMDRMQGLLFDTFVDSSLTWPELLEEFLVRFALLHGKTRWGYKAPGEFLHLEELLTLFPDTKFIFCLRDPRAVMASYKFLEGKDGTKNVYHPIAYAKYWALAQQTLEQAQQNGLNVELVLFEDAISNPIEVGKRLSTFLGSDLNETCLPEGANTSFRRGKRKNITQTEEWLCEKICGREMAKLGYSSHAPSPQLSDLLDFLQTTLRFTSYQTRRVMYSNHARGAIFNVIRRTVGV
ncbi:MAG: sulfotransferase [Bacteroidota bacterium]